MEPGFGRTYTIALQRRGACTTKGRKNRRLGWVAVVCFNRVNNYFYFTLEPGPHYFCSQESDTQSLLSLVVEAGKTYYLQQKMAMSAELQLLDEEEGKQGLAKCKLSVFEEKK